MTNYEIENVNDRELFSELFDNPINPLLTHIVPPFVDKKDPMFHVQINGEAIWKSCGEKFMGTRAYYLICFNEAFYLWDTN